MMSLHELILNIGAPFGFLSVHNDLPLIVSVRLYLASRNKKLKQKELNIQELISLQDKRSAEGRKGTCFFTS